MSFSIDGKRYKSKYVVKYGQEFPKCCKNYHVNIPSIGNCNIYIVEVDIPEWNDDLSVSVPVIYYITQILDEKKETKKVKLRVIKGGKSNEENEY